MKFLGIGEMHPVYHCILLGARVQPNQMNSYGFVGCNLFINEVLFGVSAAKP